ncbi:monovalent cation/H+ antiporter complex subunit F [Desulfonatronovibrio hydrogenovorans]|uniref:monovalent cation/H+ antiporter complex subunit F n=1 Tax=Desulfonatronovibrio hydrogenovorans TaxID=53245 RepID=UPI00048C5BEB|nr:monovalent cation/H+ antiporter complex subunit F [Desulfonatronovibrio hydrogenovorans]
MNLFYLGMALFLLLNILAGLWRVMAGPNPSDRMVCAQLFGTTGVAILLLLSQALESPYIRNAALVFALLIIPAVLAFVRNTSYEITKEN